MTTTVTGQEGEATSAQGGVLMVTEAVVVGAGVEVIESSLGAAAGAVRDT